MEGQLQFGEIFSESFMLTNTNFSSIDEFFSKSPFHINDETSETAKMSIESIPDAELDAYVKENTKFESWRDFYTTAGEIAIANRLQSIIDTLHVIRWWFDFRTWARVC